MNKYPYEIRESHPDSRAWELVYAGEWIADHQDTALDELGGYPGLPVTFSYSDGSIERVWKEVDDNFDVHRVGIIVWPAA